MKVGKFLIRGLVAAALTGCGSASPPSTTPEIGGNQQTVNPSQLAGLKAKDTLQLANASWLSGAPQDDSMRPGDAPGVAPPSPPVKKIATTIDCAGETRVECSANCALAGMSCMPLVSHPFRPKAGSGSLSACSNDGPGPFFTCAYLFDDGDICVRIKPFGLPPWVCTGSNPTPHTAENNLSENAR